MSETVVIDPVTRDIVIEDGSIQTSERPITEVLLAIGVERGRWYGDPLLGSKVREIARSSIDPDQAKSLIEAAAREGLQRLIDQGLIVLDHVEYDIDTRELAIYESANPDPYVIHVQ